MNRYCDRILNKTIDFSQGTPDVTNNTGMYDFYLQWSMDWYLFISVLVMFCREMVFNDQCSASRVHLELLLIEIKSDKRSSTLPPVDRNKHNNNIHRNTLYQHRIKLFK